MATGENSGNKEISGSQMRTSQGGNKEYGLGPRGQRELKLPVVDFTDMKQEYKEYAFQICEEAFRKSMNEENIYFKHMAEHIKSNMDEKFGGSWHVCVGKDFGNYVTYESHTMLLFWINHIGFLIWKFG